MRYILDFMSGFNLLGLFYCSEHVPLHASLRIEFDRPSFAQQEFGWAYILPNHSLLPSPSQLILVNTIWRFLIRLCPAPNPPADSPKTYTVYALVSTIRIFILISNHYCTCICSPSPSSCLYSHSMRNKYKYQK